MQGPKQNVLREQDGMRRHGVATLCVALFAMSGCSRGLAPPDDQRDSGIASHLGDAALAEDAPVFDDAQPQEGPPDAALSPQDAGSHPLYDAGTPVADGSVAADGSSGGGSGVCGSRATSGDSDLDACLSANCCPEFSNCLADPTCQACLSDPSPLACAFSPEYMDFDMCWSFFCS